MSTLLFDKDDLPREPRTIRMRVKDAGSGMIRFKCSCCGHDTGWIEDRWTVTENQRGLPCPCCNETSK